MKWISLAAMFALIAEAATATVVLVWWIWEPEILQIKIVGTLIVAMVVSAAIWSVFDD